MLEQHALSDEHWNRINVLFPGKVGDPDHTTADNRPLVKGVIFVLKT